MNTTKAPVLIHHGTLPRAEYVARVNAAAGTDIDVLEAHWILAIRRDDFADAARLERIVLAARAAAGLR